MSPASDDCVDTHCSRATRVRITAIADSQSLISPVKGDKLASMFKKKPTIKALSPLRSSDRRKIADEIIATLDLPLLDKLDANEEEKAAATAERTALRNSLFPENIQSARFTTTAGPDLKQVSGTVYAGSPPDEDSRILWVRTDSGLFPTVYTLWRNPRVLPLLHTPGIVVAKIQGGADLMTPGLANGPPFPPEAKKGAVVAIASLDSPSVPVAVGICAIDISALQQVQGSKGHAVDSLHWAGDELWAWSDKGKPGGVMPEALDAWLEEGKVDDVVNGVDGLNITNEDRDGGVPLNGSGSTNDAKEQANGESKAEDVEDDEAQAVYEKEWTTKDIDDAFRKAFLYGIHHYKTTNRDRAPTYGLDFPLTQSFTMSHLVQPFLPAFTPADSQKLQIKNTSWKNIKKFMKTLDKQQLVKTKDRQGNEVVIQDVDFNDAAVTEFKPYRLPKKATAAGSVQGRSDGSSTGAGDSASDPSVGQKIDRLELFRPREKLAPLFASAQNSKNLFTSSELRAPIEQYIAAEKLMVATNKRLVKLDPVLADVFDSNTSIDKEVLAKGEVPRDALLERVRHSCAPFWIILRNDEDLNSTTSRPKSGAPPKITITLETRGGNKTVTKVSGFEPYGIPPKPFADELRKACSGSTSVDQLQGSSPKDPKMEVMVQGPQKDAVLKALERRRINVNLKSGWVEVVDKTKKKK